MSLPTTTVFRNETDKWLECPTVYSHALACVRIARVAAFVKNKEGTEVFFDNDAENCLLLNIEYEKFKELMGITP